MSFIAAAWSISGILMFSVGLLIALGKHGVPNKLPKAVAYIVALAIFATCSAVLELLALKIVEPEPYYADAFRLIGFGLLVLVSLGTLCGAAAGLMYWLIEGIIIIGCAFGEEQGRVIPTNETPSAIATAGSRAPPARAPESVAQPSTTAKAA